MPGHGLQHTLSFANRPGQLKACLRMPLLQFLEQQRQVAFKVSATGNKHRQHDDTSKTFTDERLDAVAQLGLQELEKSQFDAHPGCLFAQGRAQTTHRLGPFGITRTMGEKN